MECCSLAPFSGEVLTPVFSLADSADSYMEKLLHTAAVKSRSTIFFRQKCFADSFIEMFRIDIFSKFCVGFS